MKYKCDICNAYDYDTDQGDEKLGVKKGSKPADFSNDWKCPICQADKTHMIEQSEEVNKKNEEINTPEKYLKDWERADDEHEELMSDIHKIAKTAKSVIEPMQSKKAIDYWSRVLIRGAQLSKIPLNENEDINTKTTIGPKAKHPLIIETPVLIAHMSFGALSKEAKIALAMGSAAVKTAMSSGEGGILDDSINNSYKYIFEYVPNEYSVSDENLTRVDAIEIKIGQSAKPGMGGHLPGVKVTAEIAKVRGREIGEDIISPAKYKDIQSGDDLKKKVEWLRKKSGGKSIGIKFVAGHLEADLKIAVEAGPDFITIDGRAGGTGAALKIVKDSVSMPTLFALYRARKYFQENNVEGISLIVTGGMRMSSDFAKALAMGADAVAIGTSALMAIACQQYRICETGNCPVGVTTHKDNLRARIKIEASAKRLENFLNVSTSELKDFARLTGNSDVHGLETDDLMTDSSEISKFTNIEHI